MNEAERIEQFEAAYNRLDRGLSDLVGRDREHQRRPFASKVRIAAQRRRRLGRYKDFLLEIGELRNAIVHNRTGDDLYLAVPSERTVRELQRVEQRILSPQRVIPRFAGEVLVLQPNQTLREAWELVRDRGFSRYPVYGRSGFEGLLTSNGFARWCAGQLREDVLHVDTTEVQVGDVLAQDHRRDAVIFVKRDMLIDEVEMMFAEQHPLEAVIVTEHGRTHEQPLGLICAGDLMTDEAASQSGRRKAGAKRTGSKTPRPRKTPS